MAGTPSPLRFASIPGGSIEVSADGKTVRRLKGQSGPNIVFSTRPIRINEKICFRFKQMTGDIKYGFTNDDTALNGYWCEQLFRKRFCKIDTVWYFYVNSSGDVHIARNGQDQCVYFSSVDIKRRLWATVEVGENTSLEFIEPTAAGVGPPAQRTPRQLLLTATEEATSSGAECLRFHDLYTGEVVLSRDGSMACVQNGFSVLFSNRPVKINEVVCLSFVNVPNRNSLRFGFTGREPLMGPSPDYMETYFLSGTENWCEKLREYLHAQDNILHFHVNPSGDVLYGINGAAVKLLCKVINTSLPIWAVIQFWDTSTVKFIDSVDFLCNWATGDVNDAEPIYLTDNQTLPGRTNNEQNQPTSHQQRTNVDSQGVAENRNHLEPAAAPYTECIICVEQNANTVFISCGHICACYGCAEQLLQGPGNGTCPVCRAEIQQIIRTYR